ncbi:uncharacterized protein [Procambarus clarkii]|uniref:uncharacterized protein n=1 Tax=Procambarus clarkii TaxID=6728 RepID=UPI00374498FC
MSRKSGVFCLILLATRVGAFISALTGGVETVRVLTFNRDGGRRGTTWLQYGQQIALRADYTLCFRFNIIVFRLETAVVYILDAEDYERFPISVDVYFERIRPKYGGFAVFHALSSNLATNKWYHYCHVRDTSGGEGRVYMDGQLLIRDNFTFQVDNAVRDVIIGQDEFMPPYSLSGKMSQVNIWRRVLTAQEILDLARCKVNMVGDVVNWEGQWTMNDLEEEEVSLGELCESQTRGIQTIRLPLLSYHHAVQVCLALRGVIRAPTTIQELVTEKAVFKGYQELNEKARWSHGGDGEKHTNTTAAPPTYLSLLLKGCERQWGGANDEAQEGSWYNPFTKTSLNSSSLAFKEFNPDGGRSQNCLHVRATGLLDTDCNKNSCSACHAAVGNTWTLRGICEDEMRMYYFDLVSLPLSLRGYGEYKVEEVGHVWTWYNSVTNTTMATLINPKHLNYPFGRLPWKLMESVCGQENGTRVLTLSPCTSEEFTCTDGTCIPFLLRCDLKFDCDDKTDETQCNIINFPSDYRSKLPPRPASDESLAISVNVSMDTVTVDTTTMLLTISYNLAMTWLDNRLTYNNLKQLTRLNTGIYEAKELGYEDEMGYEVKELEYETKELVYKAKELEYEAKELGYEDKEPGHESGMKERCLTT